MTGAGVVYLRNLDPTQRVAIPFARGLNRHVPPQACTVVPAAVLHSPRVSAGLAAERLAVVTEVNAGADARNAARLRRDMTMAIAAVAAAERQAFDRLLGPLPVYKKPRREDRAAAPYTLLKTAAARAGVAPTALRAVLNGKVTLPASLAALISRQRPASRSEQKTRGAQDSIHWRQRNDLAARLLEPAQRKHRLDPAAAAAWVIDELIPVLPVMETAGTQLSKRWTPAQDALLRRRWAEHVSAPQIGSSWDSPAVP